MPAFIYSLGDLSATLSANHRLARFVHTFVGCNQGTQVMPRLPCCRAPSLSLHCWVASNFLLLLFFLTLRAPLFLISFLLHPFSSIFTCLFPFYFILFISSFLLLSYLWFCLGTSCELCLLRLVSFWYLSCWATHVPVRLADRATLAVR